MNIKKNFTILLIFFTLLSVVFSGCQHSNTSQTTEPSETVPPIQSDLDFDQYVKKTWIAKLGDDSNPFASPSFFISELENGKIQGKFAPIGIIEPDYRLYSNDDEWRSGVFTGVVYSDRAECQLRWDQEGIMGTVVLVFINSNEIEATVQYMNTPELDEEILNGTFLLSPYNIVEKAEDDVSYKYQSFDVFLNSWGSVKFMSKEMIGGKHDYSGIYLTDENKDILYVFTYSPNSAYVKDFLFDDFNGDGLRDLILIWGYRVDDTLSAAIVFWQRPNGAFQYDEDLSIDLDEAKYNNKCKNCFKLSFKYRYYYKFGQIEDQVFAKT
jgi:hypothetical protein